MSQLNKLVIVECLGERVKINNRLRAFNTCVNEVLIVIRQASKSINLFKTKFNDNILMEYSIVMVYLILIFFFFYRNVNWFCTIFRTNLKYSLWSNLGMYILYILHIDIPNLMHIQNLVSCRSNIQKLNHT